MSGPAGFAAQEGCLGRWGTRTGSWGGRGRRGIVVVCFPCRGWRGLGEAAANGVGCLGNEGIGVIHDLPTGYVFFSRSPPSRCWELTGYTEQYCPRQSRCHEHGERGGCPRGVSGG